MDDKSATSPVKEFIRQAVEAFDADKDEVALIETIAAAQQAGLLDLAGGHALHVAICSPGEVALIDFERLEEDLEREFAEKLKESKTCFGTLAFDEADVDCITCDVCAACKVEADAKRHDELMRLERQMEEERRDQEVAVELGAWVEHRKNGVSKAKRSRKKAMDGTEPRAAVAKINYKPLVKILLDIRPLTRDAMIEQTSLYIGDVYSNGYKAKRADMLIKALCDQGAIAYDGASQRVAWLK